MSCKCLTSPWPFRYGQQQHSFLYPCLLGWVNSISPRLSGTWLGGIFYFLLVGYTNYKGKGKRIYARSYMYGPAPLLFPSFFLVKGTWLYGDWRMSAGLLVRLSLPVRLNEFLFPFFPE